MDRYVVPAAQGLAIRMGQGQRLRISTPRGSQAADFFAFRADDMGEWLSPMHTWVASRSVRPRQGDVFLSRHRRPLLDFAEDGADGVHDMMLAACDEARYRHLGFDGHHASCAENLTTALAALDLEIEVIPQPVNFFTNTHIEADGTLVSPPNPVPAGAFVELAARHDLICAVSSCPYDLAHTDWTINGPDGPTELELEVG